MHHLQAAAGKVRTCTDAGRIRAPRTRNLPLVARGAFDEAFRLLVFKVSGRRLFHSRNHRLEPRFFPQRSSREKNSEQT